MKISILAVVIATSLTASAFAAGIQIGVPTVSVSDKGVGVDTSAVPSKQDLKAAVAEQKAQTKQQLKDQLEQAKVNAATNVQGQTDTGVAAPINEKVDKVNSKLVHGQDKVNTKLNKAQNKLNSLKLGQ